MIELIRGHQQKIALAVGFVAVATIGFYGGLRINKVPEIEPAVSASSSTTNYTQENQSLQTTAENPKGQPLDPLDCTGKIKGSSSLIYHTPGGSFYKRTTNPIACFDTEAQAQAAGFRKSSR